MAAVTEDANGRMVAISSNGFHAPMQAPPMGTCCACGKSDHTVVNLATIDRVAPLPGTGWSCLACGLPPNGAMAVVCNGCIVMGRDVTHAIVGQPGSFERIALTDYPYEPFDHDLDKHPKPGRRR